MYELLFECLAILYMHCHSRIAYSARHNRNVKHFLLSRF
jgi:hypothetical protein